MSEIDAIVYGIIQGLSEFLPVSSSGHLALLPKVLYISDPGVVFDLAMHMGTALAIIIYFRKEIFSLFSLERRNFLINQVVATAVSVVFIFLLKNLSEDYGRSPLFIAFNLGFFGLVMMIADLKGTKQKTDLMYPEVQWLKAGLIGLSQALAIFPGVSRSGATLTMARMLGLSRQEATHFSFLLSLPIIFAGFLYKLPELSGQSEFNIMSVLLGITISFVVGYFTIHYFLKFIGKIGLTVFSIYRVILAIAVLMLIHTQ